MLRVRYSLMLLLLSAGMAWAALADAPPDEIENNRRLLALIRHDPEHYRRLLNHARELEALSPAARARIQLLDREIQAEPSAAQVRLLRAAERYADWLRLLAPEDRARVEGEADKDKRLAVIKEIRQRQYADQLPAPLRERLDRSLDRTATLNLLRQDERRWKRDWGIALQHWDEACANALPERLEKLPHEARDYVKDE
jgi:hypothetical protein